MTNLARPRRGPGRPRGSTSARTRALVLEAATELISAQGYLATSMAQIAEAAGISNTGLVHHFRTKEDLLAALLQRRDDGDAVIVEDHGTEPWAEAEQFVALARTNETRAEFVRMFVQVSAEATDPHHPAHEWLNGHYARTYEILVAGFERGRTEGWLSASSPEPDHMARAFIAMMDGLQLQWLVAPDDVPMADLLNEYLDSMKGRWGTA